MGSGKLINSNGVEMMSFDLMAAKHFSKPAGQKGGRSQVIFTGDWDGHFGPKFTEGRRTLQVDKFDELTVWSIKEGDTEQAYVLSGEAAKASAMQEGQPGSGSQVAQITMAEADLAGGEDANDAPMNGGGE